VRNTFSDFTCGQCGSFVASMHMLSGVNNRNHCPYCLWSRHLDLYSAGDRLSACKAKMKPIGLTMKKGRNKYQLSPRGELMLVHACTGCNSVSINRIAADDDPDTILDVFRTSLQHDQEHEDVAMLKAEDIQEVYIQLHGQNAVV
jgi:hypothetical protein